MKTAAVATIAFSVVAQPLATIVNAEEVTVNKAERQLETQTASTNSTNLLAHPDFVTNANGIGYVGWTPVTATYDGIVNHNQTRVKDIKPSTFEYQYSESFRKNGTIIGDHSNYISFSEDGNKSISFYGPRNYSQSAQGVQQTIKTIPGQKYTVKSNLGINTPWYQNPDNLSWTPGGAAIITVMDSNKNKLSEGSTPWNQNNSNFALEFVATSTTTDISLISVYGAKFSNVQVTQKTSLMVDDITSDTTKVTGIGLPNQAVTVTIGSKQYSGTTDSTGKFSIDITKPTPGQTVTITSGTDVIEKTVIDKTGETATVSVDGLFVDNDPTKPIKDTTDQAKIDAAQAEVNKVVDPTVKEDLQKDIDNAQAQLDKKESDAATAAGKEAVDGLFVNNDPSKDIKDTTDQAKIDAAQAVVNKITDPAVKEDLQKDIDKAQDQLDKKEEAATAAAAEKAAQEAAKTSVDGLFMNNDPSQDIKTTTDQAKIDAAQALVNKVTDPAVKADLQKDIDNAQAKLDAKNAVLTAPTVNNVTNKDTVVTGKGTPGLTAVVKIGTATYTATIGADGKYSVTIPVQKADTVITVAQKNSAKTGPSTTVKVANYIPATAPMVDSVAPFQQAITGKAPAGTVSVRLIVNGVPQRLVAPDANGNFSFYSRFVSDGTVSNLRLKQGDIVTVDYGNKTPANLATSVTVSQAAKPIIDTVKAKSDYITGLVPTGTQVLRLSINGVAQRTVTPQANIDAVTAGGIGSNGRFKIYSRFFKDETGVSRKLKAGDKITVDLGAQIPGDTGTTVTVVAK
ncbi:toxin Cry1Ac domain D-VI-related protein [Listeria rustica]|uniref:Bacterial Ig domain-containing protein n=1 Tax=Listeria rustica TaxID=2713503 RepID=A0A7W1YG41_9LIST|nr:toxin Cry1Ac domain D-VI-related protein [Listeria rustica]MBA3926267.1 hypothetical protein [Listeria rustica]